MAVEKGKFKTFCVHYEFAGREWAFDIKAANRVEAELRLDVIKESAWIAGELMAVINLKDSVDSTDLPDLHAN